MPSLFTNSSAAKGSTRRPRGESESRRPTSHRVDSERRRAKESSRNTERRSPPSKTNPQATGIYSQPNVQQDQTPISPVSDDDSPASTHSPDMRVATTGSTGNYQFQLETPLALQQYLDTEDEDATPQPRRAPAMPPAPQPPPAVNPSKPEPDSRPLTPELSDSKDDQETVTGSPQHMSMSMPQLRRDVSQDSHPPLPSPTASRAFTPPPSVRQSNIQQLAQPMPVYPLPMPDPQAYYHQPMQHMPPQPHHLPQQQPYMYEPRYDEGPRYDMQARQHFAYYNQPANHYNQSPEPYRHHRLSMASVGGESQFTQDSGDRATGGSHEHPATGRTSPQDETSDLLTRISSALPDLQLLLSRCEEVTGQHSHHKEPKLLTSGAGEDSHVDALLKQKDTRIEELEKELASRNQVHVAERNKMRFEIGNLQEQYKDLQDDLVAFKRRDSASNSPTATTKRGGDPIASDLPSDQALKLKSDLEASRRRTTELEDSKSASDRQLAALENQLRALTAELEHKKSTESTLQQRLTAALDANARDRETHTRERDALMAASAAAAAGGKGGSEGIRELTEGLAREKRDLEAALRARDVRLEESRKIWAKDLEEARRAGARELDEARRGFAREKEELGVRAAKEKEGFEEERGRMRAETEREARSVARRHEKALAELERGLEAKFGEEFKEVEAELSRARRDYKRVKRDWHVERERTGEERGRLKAAAGRLQVEHAGFVRLLEQMAEVEVQGREGGRERKKRGVAVEEKGEADDL